MGDLEKLSAHRKIPVYVFLKNDVLRGTYEILFLTLDAPSLFECIRYHMTPMAEAMSKQRCMSFSFETRMYSPNEINKISEEISRRKQERMQQPTPKPLEKEKNFVLRLVPDPEDPKL